MTLDNKMTPTEQRATFALASIMFMRMLGLFMILPVFAVYAQHHFPDAQPILIGLAIGIYGLTQATFQIPFGMLSDRFGRKPMITLGLLIFAAGSLMAASATSILGIIIGRALQGMGAIASAVLALTADLTREEHRTKAMALMGITFGLAFMLALAISPVLNRWIGVPGIFLLAASLAVIAVIMLYLLVPQPMDSRFHRDTEPMPTQFKRILADSQLLRLDIGVLFLHCSLTSLFVVFPIALKQQLDSAHHWQVYLPVLIAAAITIIPFIIYAEKYRRLKSVFLTAIGILGLSLMGLSLLHHSLMSMAIMLFLFFTAFNLLEATLPSLISKMAPADSKGTAMGIYSTAQFLGTFLGGVIGGWLHQHQGISAVFMFSALLTILWLIFATSMQNPRYLRSHLLNLGTINKQQADQLTQCLSKITGVAEVIIILEEGIAYLKVDRQTLDEEALEKCSFPSVQI